MCFERWDECLRFVLHGVSSCVSADTQTLVLMSFVHLLSGFMQCYEHDAYCSAQV